MSNSPDLDLSAIVVCRDDEERVGHQVRRLSAHLRDLGQRFEIIAVDELSGDNTLTLLGRLKLELPELRVIAGARPGDGYVRGAEQAQGRAILLLDARCEAPLSALGFALGRLGDGWDATAVHGRFLLLRRARTFSAFSALTHHRDPVELERRFLRRAASLGLRVDHASNLPRHASPWHRFRDGVLLPLAARAWY
jgi:hypothetical protein